MTIVGLTLTVKWYSQALHTAGAPEIWIDQLRLSTREKLNCPDVNEVSTEIRHFFSLEMH